MSAQEDTTDLEQTGAVPEAKKGFVIRWLSPGAACVYTRLDQNQLTLGRGASSDAVLEASGVSREHAVLTRQGPVYSIADNKSTNGTYVNGERIKHAALAVGDVLRLGEMVGVVLRLPKSIDLSEPDVEVLSDAVFGPGLKSELETLKKSAPTTLPVVVVGETGVGKESVARVLHAFSARPGPFHAVNCAALPASLAEAELFGYRKGAFTGAEQAGVGHLRAAHGGTLLLDELADLAPLVQAKLLRALQDSEVTPLGETKAVRLDLRVVAACQELPSELVRAGRLREDLVMRLSGITLVVPPLRERRADVALLLGYFLKRWGGEGAPAIAANTLERLLLYPWPGNVRELELLARNLLVLHGQEPILRRSMLPETFGRASNTPSRDELGAPDRGEHDLERLKRELEKNGGNVSAAASAIGISRQRAYRLMNGRTVEELLHAARLDVEPSEQE
jgi:transcriptional regulator with PAS, ATPase and Fis domain